MNQSLFYFSAILIITTSSASLAESPSGVRVGNIRVRGDGCPQNSASATISPDGTSFSILFDSYQVESNESFQIDRKACEAEIDLQLERGWSYAIVAADYRGFVNVDAGSIATHQALYSFDGSRPINERPGFENGNGRHSFRSQEFRGPFSNNYFVRNEIPPGLAPWSPCNERDHQTLFLTNYLTARTMSRAMPSSALITLDSIDGQIQSQEYKFIWRKCRPGPIRPPDRPPRRDPVRPSPRPPRFR